MSNCDLFEDLLPIDDSKMDDVNPRATDKSGKQTTPKTHDPQNETPKKRGRPKKVKDGLDSSHVEIPETSTAIVESGTGVNPDVDVNTNSEPEKPKPRIDLSIAIDPTQDGIKTRIDLFDNNGKRKSQATLLIEIGQLNALFHCQNKNGYTCIAGKAVMALKSSSYKEYLSHEVFKLTGIGCNRNAITDALDTLESIAKFNNPMHDVYMRVANLDSTIYIDLGCSDWRVIQITQDGWQVLNKSPVKFVRKQGATALPEPTKDGDITLLNQYLNVDAQQMPLIIGWVLCALSGVKPYPILILQGEQGTGKSTTSRVLRSLIDPSAVPLRSPPKEVRDLLVSASNNHVVVQDNLSGLTAEMSDCLCRLSTGGGIDMRALYTDNEQVLIDIQRPVLINGIDDVANRQDLAERALIVHLPVINGDNRKSERQFWKEFDTDKPLILGALLDLIAVGLKHRDTVKLPYKPRMADVAQWVLACEQGLTYSGGFMSAHEKNQYEAIEQGLDSSPVGSAIMELMDREDNWIGTPTELLDTLALIAGDRQTRSKSWVQSPKGLSNAIKRLTPSLRKMGITIEESRTNKSRLYKLCKVGFYPSQPSPSVTDSHSLRTARGDTVTDRVTDSDRVTDNIETVTDRIIDSKPLESMPFIASKGVVTDSDGCDTYKPTLHNEGIKLNHTLIPDTDTSPAQNTLRI